MTIRDALPTEAEELFELALRSKAAWGYDDSFLRACEKELFPSDLSRAGVMVQGERCVGFYTLEIEEAGTLELGHLFVEPGHFRKGIGRRLLAHAAERARAQGHATLTIQGDPHARGFYERCGARYVTERPSGSIVGRSLPLFVLDLTSSALR